MNYSTFSAHFRVFRTAIAVAFLFLIAQMAGVTALSVTVGCNIHDRMTAYIHVANTPYFARTDNSGRARIDGLGAGKYVVKSWFYKTPGDAQVQEQPLIVAAADTSAIVRPKAAIAATPAATK